MKATVTEDGTDLLQLFACVLFGKRNDRNTSASILLAFPVKVKDVHAVVEKEARRGPLGLMEGRGGMMMAAPLLLLLLLGADLE